MREQIDRWLYRLAWVVVRAFFRTARIEHGERVPRDRPVLIISNHFNGFVDPVLLLFGLKRLPRFLAKATLWKNPVARPLARLAGLIPIYRSEDGDTEGNRSAFEACHEALADDEMLGIFPEGTTHDESAIVEVRTGAARIALGSVAAGVKGLLIVPLGIHYDDKSAWRSRAWVQVGEPIDLDADLSEFVRDGEEADETNHEAVHRLTSAIEKRLRGVSPDYENWQEAQALAEAAEVTLRTRLTDPRADVRLSARERVTARLAKLPDEAQEEIIAASAAYRRDLDLLDLDDGQLYPHRSGPEMLGVLAWSGARVATLSPLGGIGLFLNLVPMSLVGWVGGKPEAEVTKGTVKFFSSLVLYPVAWILWAVLAKRVTGRRTAGAVAFFAGPLGGWTWIYTAERWVRLRRAWQGWSRFRSSSDLLDDVLAHRRAVVDAVEAHVTIRLVPEVAESA